MQENEEAHGRWDDINQVLANDFFFRHNAALTLGTVEAFFAWAHEPQTSKFDVKKTASIDRGNGKIEIGSRCIF